MVAQWTRQFFVKRDIAPCRLVAAVSGGVDSTALLLALADLRADGFELVAAHVNHRLRGADSDADERFIRDLCETLGVELHVADGTLDEPLVRELGIEGAARQVRYARLREIRDATQARFVATAHQKNDQAETVLMRVLTGTAIAGLRGIHPVREDGFIRPLLDVTRTQIEAFLTQRGVTPRFDRSNDDPRFLRNRVRALLRDMGGIASLASIADQAQRVWPIVERAIDAAEQVEATANETRFLAWPEDAFLRQALLHRHIRRLEPGARDVSAADLARLAAQLDAIRRVSVTKSLELVRRDGLLVLRRPLEPVAEFEVELTPDIAAFIPELNTTVHIRRPPTSDSRQRFQLPDGAETRFTVRNRRRGDRFHPLGLAGPKKLKDFLIDRKIAAEVRDRLLLLLWNDEIVWIAGVEVSERFKVTSPPAALIFEVWLEDPGEGDDRDPADLQR
jgi:tRNA(Ile)-lysidine synthase